MDWIINLFTDTNSIAHIILLYSIVISVGMILGKARIAGISLGVTFVLFAGIAAGHVSFTAPPQVLNFLQDFGLVLFVYCIGLQVGPGFFNSFKKSGITMNMLAIMTVLLNVIVMFACYYIFFDTDNPSNLPMMVGTMSGAVTNTPGLGAASESLNSLSGLFQGGLPQIANGYACAYPLGVLGIIGTTILIRYICRINLDKEEEALEEEEGEDPALKPVRMTIKVTNEAVDGITMYRLAQYVNRPLVCSRMLRGTEVMVPQKNTEFRLGDELLIVCAENDKEAIKAFIGTEIAVNWDEESVEHRVVNRRLVVTNQNLNGKKLAKTRIASLYGVHITRVTRQGLDFLASSDFIIHLGDRLTVVGAEENVNRVEEVIGNSVKRLNAPNLATIFIGIILGIALGSIPFFIKGIPVPVKLGIAGGPLVVAILIGRYGDRMRLITYLSTSANMMLREFGLVLFLASVGIKAGAGFWDTVVSGDGVKFVYTGFLITVIPILVIGLVARLKYKMNYFTIMGMIAGSYTDPPALAYASSTCSHNAPLVGYSTVYPLTMFLRILAAQLIVLLCCGV